jgi:hypothetical protein
VGDPDAELRLPSDAVTPDTTVTLDASGSTDPYGEIVSYEWSVSGETLTGQTTSLALEDPGTYTVELTVTNDAGETDVVTGTLVVSDPASTDDAPNTAAAAEGAADGAGPTESVDRETFGAVPPLWLLGLGAAFVVVVLGLTAILRRDGSAQDRL